MLLYSLQYFTITLNDSEALCNETKPVLNKIVLYLHRYYEYVEDDWAIKQGNIRQNLGLRAPHSTQNPVSYSGGSWWWRPGIWSQPHLSWVCSTNESFDLDSKKVISWIKIHPFTGFCSYPVMFFVKYFFIAKVVVA